MQFIRLPNFHKLTDHYNHACLVLVIGFLALVKFDVLLLGLLWGKFVGCLSPSIVLVAALFI